MSYDLQVWSVKQLEPNAFRRPEDWHKHSTTWIHARRNWQIVVSSSDHVEAEDVPEEVMKALPGIEWLTNLNLEGKATRGALHLSQSTATNIARSSHGVVIDQQDGSMRLPSGVKRFMLPRSKETFDVILMSWWFLEGPLVSHEGRAQFVNLIERLLPEALPKRYGLYEPPQHVYANTGRHHFLRFWAENLHDQIVWYPHRPIAYVNVGFPNPTGLQKLGFRTNQLTIEIEKEALSQPGWDRNLRRFWKQASILIRPIYGDVRTLHGYEWTGATVGRRTTSRQGVVVGGNSRTPRDCGRTRKDLSEALA